MPVPKPDLPFTGDITWLTPEQDGRADGPPRTPWSTYYYATAFVPPRTIDDGTVPIIVNVAVRDAWTSHAWAGWVDVPGPGVDEGSVLMITEGDDTVAIFTVRGVERGDGAAQGRRPLSGQAIAEMEARAGAATPGPWRSWWEGRDGVGGDSFVLTGPDEDRGPDLFLTWDAGVSHAQRRADQDFIAHARHDVPDLAADLRELRDRVGLGIDNETTDDGDETLAVSIYIVQTEPERDDLWQLGAFTSEREALKTLYAARDTWPWARWSIRHVDLWNRFADYQTESEL